MEFLEALEIQEREVHNAQTLFSAREDGTSVSAGRNRFRGRVNQLEYKKNLTAALKFVNEVVSGAKHPYLLQEVMTTDDFPQYMGDILDRQLLANYVEWPATWTAYAKRSLVNDFKDAKLIPPVYGADGPLDIVPEADQYPDANLSEQAPILWHVQKYGRRIPFSWETIINDDLDQFTDMPQRLARAARRTEHRLVTGLFIGVNGPLSTTYHNNYGNIVNTTNGSLNGNNPPLSIQGLQSAYNVLSKMTDEMGEPIVRDVITLVVPPALEIPAMNILNAVQIWDTTSMGGATPPNPATAGEQMLQVKNWLSGRLRVVVDPYIPLLATSANGSTSWFIFADPNYSREAIRIGFLRGHESPEIWMKSPNAVRVGGGAVSPMSGDFDTDSIEYRIRHVTGATVVDRKATVASNGSGS
jgi:hypothetical protein